MFYVVHFTFISALLTYAIKKKRNIINNAIYIKNVILTKLHLKNVLLIGYSYIPICYRNIKRDNETKTRQKNETKKIYTV